MRCRLPANRLETVRLVGGEVTVQLGVQLIAYERRFAAAAYACYYGKDTERKPYVDIFRLLAVAFFISIKLCQRLRRAGTSILSLPYIYCNVYEALMSSSGSFGCVACKYYLAAACARLGSYVDKIVGRAYYLGVVFDDYYRIAYVSELFEHCQQTLRVTTVESYRRLVEHV